MAAARCALLKAPGARLTGSDVQGCVLCLVPCIHNDSSSHQDLQDLRLAKGSCVVQNAAVLLQAAQRLQQGRYRLKDKLPCNRTCPM